METNDSEDTYSRLVRNSINTWQLPVKMLQLTEKMLYTVRCRVLSAGFRPNEIQKQNVWFTFVKVKQIKLSVASFTSF